MPVCSGGAILSYIGSLLTDNPQDFSTLIQSLIVTNLTVYAISTAFEHNAKNHLAQAIANHEELFHEADDVIIMPDNRNVLHFNFCKDQPTEPAVIDVPHEVVQPA